MIDAADLKAMCPNTPAERLQVFVPWLNAAMAEYEIDTPQRQAAFLAQIAHESGGFRWVREIWGPTEQQKRYEGRADLGNTQPGDGRRYMGRGLIQVTARSNYRTCGRALGLDLEENPQLLELPQHACSSAAWFWSSRKLNDLADLDEFERITRRINGGLNGLAERVAYYEIAQGLLA